MLFNVSATNSEKLIPFLKKKKHQVLKCYCKIIRIFMIPREKIGTDIHKTKKIVKHKFT